MAKYTTTIKTLRDVNFPLGMTAADYPIFDESYRAALNKKILDHYQFREIGFETPGLFAWFLNVKLREIMPYYNQLYESATLTFNPLHNFETTEESTRTVEGTSVSSGDSESNMENASTANGKAVSSDTPQGMLSFENIAANKYATAANLDETKADATGKNTTVQNSENTLNNVDAYIRTVRGNNGSASFASLLKEYRTTLLNVDMMVIRELETLFMSIY